MDVATFLVQCLNALQYGLLLFLVASGLTLIFGIMGVINLAHGSFYMIGAYMAYALVPAFAAHAVRRGLRDYLAHIPCPGKGVFDLYSHRSIRAQFQHCGLRAVQI